MSGEESLCARVGVNTIQREDQKYTDNVTSWTACSNVCREREDCKYWTWRTENSSVPNRCLTMTGYSHTKEGAKTVTGDRNCGGSTTTTTTTASIEGMEILNTRHFSHLFVLR